VPRKKVDTADPRTKKDEAYGRRECVSVDLGEREDGSLVVDKKVLRAVPESMRRTVKEGERKTNDTTKRRAMRGNAM
jgi:hypothetical protein